MVKKKNKKEKGRGAEKTAQKLAKKSKKEEGMEDLEALIAEFKLIDKKKTEFYEEKCKQPSPRCNLTVNVHPEKDEIILFGGEYDTGNKTYVYNDLFTYSIKKNEWSQLFVPNPPPRRCAHQAVTIAKDGGQMWLFGGEFASPTHSKFYHYKDFWVLSLQKKTWEQINAPGGPSARSGHRMINFKKQLLVFGGFHESSTNFVYFNDVHSFDLSSYQWSKLIPNGHGPSPRSGCHLVPTPTGVLIVGGYSKIKVKKDMDKGTPHNDIFHLEPDIVTCTSTKDNSVTKWKWGKVKESGDKPSTRSSYGMASIGGNRAVIFGGVFDEDEEDDINSIFYNTMHCLDLTSFRWFPFKLRKVKKKENKKDIKETDETKSDEEDVKIEDQELEEGKPVQKDLIWIPCGRMNPSIVTKNGYLYLYGGAFEEDEKQVTLNDLWSLNLKSPTTWNQLFESDDTSHDWHESDSSSSEEEDSKADEACALQDNGDVVDEHPSVTEIESINEFWSRTSEHWLQVMSDAADEDTPADEIRGAAEDMAHAHFRREKRRLKKCKAK